MSECGPEMMREHERRITDAAAEAKSAHERISAESKAVNERITALVELFKNFTIEMRASNNNITDLIGEVKALTIEIGYVSKATSKHEEDIAEIKDNMETKDTVLKLYSKIEDSNEKYKKGQDDVMEALRKQKAALEEHKQEPAEQALANQKALVRWLIVGFGSVLLTIITTAVAIFVFGK